MAATVTIRDETTTGQVTGEITIAFLTERMTVRELIRSRVYQEVKDHNVQSGQQHFRGLVQPTDTEMELNGYRLRPGRTIDWQKQFDAALDTFQDNRFLILIDDRQAERLDEEIVITPATQISFLKLVPLVGG